jgi:UDP-3-O-[3-hydroxymyristoyl] N-acetylglucosamine deacetylase / 3-hydroxyacyl-[acyl-carrier-protein] dehydratase
MSKQLTIQTAFSLEGKGLHSNKLVNIHVLAAAENTGICFKRVDLTAQPIIKADVANVSKTVRSTILSAQNAEVGTVEHFLSACYALGVDNLLVEINAEEMPILDGSALPFFLALVSAKILEQNAEKNVFVVEKPFSVQLNDSEISFAPAPSLEICNLIDFDNSVIGQQFATLKNINDYETQIAAARTFVFLHEIQPLLSAGLVKGGDLDNALVFVNQIPSETELQNLANLLSKPNILVDKTGILNLTNLRFTNEPARHKLLDLIGDLALAGVQIQGKITAYKSGHSINTQAAAAVKTAYKQQLKTREIPKYDPTQKPALDINQITAQLQHRFPFLLIDKIMELTDKHIIGIKNVTMNEPFFAGHFPDNPVMPGVLQIEAMAQTGGLFVFKAMGIDNPLEWDTYFLKINNARFREKVLPGDTLIIKLELMSPVRRGLCEMSAKMYVADKVVAEAEVLAQVLKRK